LSDLRQAIEDGRSALTEPESKALLDGFGIRTPRGLFVSVGEALPLLPFEPPYVVKVVSDQLLHKSDAGGVRLGLGDAQAVRAAMTDTGSLPGVSGWLVEEMLPAGLELVVGGTRHPRFGPMVMVGLGGILVEYLQDVSLRICPIDELAAREMLSELRASALLDGVRGQTGVDREALVQVLLAVGGVQGLLMTHQGSVAELDINPVIANATGVAAADARVILASQEAPEERARLDALRPLLEPNAIAVAGASANGSAYGNQYIRHLRAYGFDGPIYPIHPKAESIDGLPAFPSLCALPEPVDYAFIAVSADRCPALLAAADGRVNVAQVMAGGFGEGGGDSALEAGLLKSAQAGGARLLGPNCMGTHSPMGKLTYVSGPDPEPGTVAVIAQSGGLSMDVIRRGRQRGIKFRAVTSVGNCADLGVAELLPAFLEDDATKVVGLYLEDARRGRALFDLLTMNRGAKPIALLVGGRSAQGARAAMSHTGALAGDARAWDALASQCAMGMTEGLDEFLDLLLAMQTLTPRIQGHTKEVVLFGNGGGASVLATDAFANAGLRVTPLPANTQAALRELNLPQGASVGNPVDIPANVLQREQGQIVRFIVERIFAEAHPDAFVIHVNVPVILGYTHVDILGQLIEATMQARKLHGQSAHIALVLRSDGEANIERRKAELRAQALRAGIVVYDELDRAAKALGGLARCERALDRSRGRRR